MSSSPSPKPAGFIGKRRSRKTRPSLIIVDAVARALITLGGIGTILAVVLVCVFLVSVTLPLFWPGSLTSQPSVAPSKNFLGRPVAFGSDEQFQVGWQADESGKLVAFRLDTGERIVEVSLIKGDRKVSSIAFESGGAFVLGFADGAIQMGHLKFDSDLVDASELAEPAKSLQPGAGMVWEEGLLQRTSEGQFRLTKLELKFDEPVMVKSGVAIRRIDLSIQRGESTGEGAGSEIVSLLTDDGEFRIARVKRTMNILSKKMTTKLTQGTLAINLLDGKQPAFMRLSGLGDNVYLVWDDGRTQRIDSSVINQPALVEEIDLVDGDAKLTSLEFLLGKTSLVVGDSKGKVHVWFRIKPDGAKTSDGAVLARAHELLGGTSQVTSLAMSSRARTVAAGYADGSVRLFHVTSSQLLATAKTDEQAAVVKLALAPKDDALVALTSRDSSSTSGLQRWKVDVQHPEATLGAMFTQVWYEGYERPEHVWQSSSGTDDFEPKFGMLPLVFGTLKATCYSMLFGAPLALLAAIYTSEFLHPKTKARVKPTVEIMASLPSVVLGFMAALVIAPIVEDFIPEVLTLLLTLPFSVLLGAYLWQLIPPNIAMKYRYWRIPAVFVAMGCGFILASTAGRTVESMLFAGDVRAWLEGKAGSSIGGWTWMLTPLCGLLMAFINQRWVTPRVRVFAEGWTRVRFVLFDLGRYLLCCVATLVMAALFGVVLNAIGWDLRGTFLDTYVQRNAMIVGFIMGFAIIPIIYTISDDALSSVPESLRAASLGAGATPWQTAVKVIIPTAMSGLFSALMIGLGRAVGETMIVLMAAGNTPVMEWNIFNGFRTLSANIAVELPEAVKDSTHYRMLFLAALCLFGLTFVLNTLAEIVRQRFRKRAFQL